MILTHATSVGKRPYQEDRIAIVSGKSYVLAAVFDGHGGYTAAHDCALELKSIWGRTGILRMSVAERLRETVKALAMNVSHMSEGTTASIAYIPKKGKKVTVAIVGDSPVLIHDGNGNFHQSPEHNVRSNPREAAAARERGGFIQGGYLFERFDGPGLQMSRALGDANLAGVLSREPEIYQATISPGGWVLVATDGLLDPAHSGKDGAENIRRLIAEGADAQALVDYAVNVPTRDNVSAILVRL